MDCYEESIHQVLNDYGISAPDEAVKDIIAALDMCNEYASYSTGGHNPQAEEISKLKKELVREQEKTICSECRGSGRIVEQGPYHGSDSGCWKCSGTGYIYHS